MAPNAPKMPQTTTKRTQTPQNAPKHLSPFPSRLLLQRPTVAASEPRWVSGAALAVAVTPSCFHRAGTCS